MQKDFCNNIGTNRTYRGVCYLSAFGAKRTCTIMWLRPPRSQMTQSNIRRLGIPQCSGLLAHRVCYRLGGRTKEGVVAPPLIQNDSGLTQGVLACQWQADRETDRAGRWPPWSLLVAPARGEEAPCSA